MRHSRRIALALGLLSFVLAIQPAASRADTLSAAPPDQLGKVNFPTSCTPDVQPTIEKGVALLHSFQYKESEQTFSDAATKEPKCAIAHWGKAMARFHQLWDFPNDKTLKESRKDIETAQKLHSANSREQGFLDAAAAFFQKKSKMTHADRIKGYSTVLERLFPENPGDAEIGSSYPLSPGSLASEDTDNETAHPHKATPLPNPPLQPNLYHPPAPQYSIH